MMKLALGSAMFTVASAATNSLSFLLLGDWGGASDAAPTTPGETCNADGMGQVASKLNASFVLALGDNFYQKGVTNATKGRMQSTFEDVFTAPSLDVDWYVVAGNHDHYGEVQVQLDYAKQSTRWKFPDLKYSFTKTLPSGKVAEFVMFDSYVAAGMSYQDDEGNFVAAPGPSDKALAQEQWTWIEQTLRNSTADYLFTACHYPVWSVCKHGPTKDLVDHLRPLLSKYAVSAHFAGHDHCLEHVVDGTVQHVLSGAGSKAWGPYWFLHQDTLKKHGAEVKWYMAWAISNSYKGGFASVEMTDEAAVVKYYGDDGTLLYAADPISPRSLTALATGRLPCDVTNSTTLPCEVAESISEDKVDADGGDALRGGIPRLYAEDSGLAHGLGTPAVAATSAVMLMISAGVAVGACRRLSRPPAYTDGSEEPILPEADED